MSFTIRMSMDDLTCDLQLRSGIPISQSMLIEALKDLVDQMECEVLVPKDDIQ